MSISPSYDHLAAMSDTIGVFEHALYDAPRREHGYCVDDVARALIVVIREPEQTPQLVDLGETYLRFLEAAIDDSGSSHNRMTEHGSWSDEPSLGDWWGRSIWALGITATHATSALTRKRALRAFRRASVARSPFMRAMAFAALGAAEIVIEFPGDESARGLLIAAVAKIPQSSQRDWPWPEDRLTYGNGSVAEAIIVAGHALNDPIMQSRGLDVLEFLLQLETTEGRLSVTGTAGRARGDLAVQFDQQPIEVAAIIDACARAFDLTGNVRWLAGVEVGWRWFTGDNDSATEMFDNESGAGYDGLTSVGRNENRGAESTLAALSSYQQARRLGQLRELAVTP